MTCQRDKRSVPLFPDTSLYDLHTIMDVCTCTTFSMPLKTDRCYCCVCVCDERVPMSAISLDRLCLVCNFIVTREGGIFGSSPHISIIVSHSRETS